MANTDYSFRQLLEIDSCTNCRLCADACPATSAAQDGELSAIWRMDTLKQILKGRAGLFRQFIKSKRTSEDYLKHFSDTSFKCTLCGNCQEVCPVGIRLRDLWVSLRQDMVHSSIYPKKIDMIRENMEETHNVFGEDNEERADWVEDMRNPPDNGYIKDKAEVVYFTGCTASYYPLAQKIPIALAEILDLGRVDFTLLGEEEWCCGFPLLGAGLMDMFETFKNHNIEAIRQKGAKEIVFACPSCYQMWREYYPPDFKLTHASQFLANLIKEKRVPLNVMPLKVTYHDPCDLGRGARIFDEPRDVIRSIPGIEFVELPHNRERCLCCGGGGNLEMTDAKLSADIAKTKIDEALSTGADAIITACQQCVRTMATYARRNKIPIQVMDITELIRNAAKG
ncbi:MAG: (Fe-S)-binding protein [Deltaproteobacteria bacterium]|nr:(Fe-S)-binding protein [Deltaproteobacteria bacterium]